MRHIWKKRVMGLLTAGGVLCAQSACLMRFAPSLVSAQDQTSSVADMTNDLAETQMIEIDAPKLVQGQDSLKQASAAVDATETAYEEDTFASYHGYDALDDTQKNVYSALKESAHSFYIGQEDAQTVNYTGGSLPCFASISISRTAQLTPADMAEVLSMFRNDNPIYYFVGNSMLYSTSTSMVTGETYVTNLYVSCMDEYVDGFTRQQETAVLNQTISNVLANMPAYTTALERTTAVHDWICQTIEYAYDASGNPDASLNSHSIIGVFDMQYGAAVCEGYAKAFQLLLNAVDVENYYIVGLGNGGGHAWNMARMDDGFFYHFDATWDDTTDNYYFAAGDSTFASSHVPYTVDRTAWEYLYDLPDVPNDGYGGAVGSTYIDGDFTYALYDDYASLVSYTGTDMYVDVPDEANGLPVTQVQGAFANHSNLQEVVLPETVTVVSYGADGIGAFENCASLKNVTFSNALETIAYDSFFSCSALESVDLPASLLQLGARAFANCNSLGRLAFYGASSRIVSQTSIYRDTTIYGLFLSTAQTYAEQYTRKFVLLDTSATTTTTETTTTTTTETTTTSTTTTTTTTEPTTTTTSSTTTSATTTETTTTTTTATTTETPKIMVADMDQDGKCSMNDLVFLNRYLLESVQATPYQVAAMDCYCDGEINGSDSLTMVKFLIHLIYEIPVYAES